MATKQDDKRLKNQRYAAIFLFLIISFGIFLRTYNFHDWLRFNADQARDASVVRAMVEKHEIPLLGPVAGGTNFRIGPMSIYFQFLGAWIFEAAPDKMAYADLLFGILSVPLIFLMLREYFSKRVALASAALYAASYFAVQYSRFAWNSNSAQFFVIMLLYSVIKIAKVNGGKKILWAVIFGAALGIVMQLHTLLLFSAPLFFIVMAVHLVKNKRISIGHVAIIAAMVIATNAPQIVHEIRTEQGNAVAFFDALLKKSPKQASLGANVLHVVSCQAQANARILLPQNDQEDCGFPLTESSIKKIGNKNSNMPLFIANVAGFLIAVLFSLFGYYRIIIRAFREKDAEKKLFFAVIFAYCASLLLVSFPFGAEISLRYFILTAFVPYLFAALFLEWIMERHESPRFVLASFSAIGLIFFYNIYFCAQVFRTYAASSGNMIDGSMLQAQQIAEYLMLKSPSSSSFQVGGKNTDLGRFVDRISYFVNRSGMAVVELDDQKKADARLPFFVVVSDMSKKCEPGSHYKDYGIIEECKKIDDVAILKIDQ